MTRHLPHPVLTLSLVLTWMLLTRFSLGHLILGSAVAVVAVRAFTTLHPSGPRIRRWSMIPRLILVVAWDILRSNLEVARIVVMRPRGRRAGFVDIPLDLRDRTGLTWLSVIVTATPGTAWIEYDASGDMLLLHVLDLGDAEEEMRQLIKNRYEAMLMEIFE